MARHSSGLFDTNAMDYTTLFHTHAADDVVQEGWLMKKRESAGFDSWGRWYFRLQKNGQLRMSKSEAGVDAKLVCTVSARSKVLNSARNRDTFKIHGDAVVEDRQKFKCASDEEYNDWVHAMDEVVRRSEKKEHEAVVSDLKEWHTHLLKRKEMGYKQEIYQLKRLLEQARATQYEDLVRMRSLIAASKEKHAKGGGGGSKGSLKEAAKLRAEMKLLRERNDMLIQRLREMNEAAAHLTDGCRPSPPPSPQPHAPRSSPVSSRRRPAPSIWPSSRGRAAITVKAALTLPSTDRTHTALDSAMHLLNVHYQSGWVTQTSARSRPQRHPTPRWCAARAGHAQVGSA